MSGSRQSSESYPLDHLAVARARDLHQSLQEWFSTEELETLTRTIISGLSRRMSHRTPPERAPDGDAVNALVDALIGPVEPRAMEMVLSALRDGVPLETIYLGYLGGAAVTLGDRWNDDQASLFDVTLGTGRIYAILRGLQPLLVPPAQVGARHALFVALEKDDHTIGVNIAANYFRQHGWHVDVLDHHSEAHLVRAMENLHHQIVGISFSQPEHLSAVCRLVVALRVARPEVFLLLSGAAVSDVADVVEKTDVDVVAGDAPEALDQLEQLLAGGTLT